MRRCWVRMLVPGAAAVACAVPSAVTVAAKAEVGSAVPVALAGGWGKVIGVPGLGALNKGGSVPFISLSCVTAGNCAAAGDYSDASFHAQGFVVSEVNGRWRKAIEVPGLGLLNTDGDAGVSTVSCAAAGNCAAGGGYVEGGFSNVQGFVVSEVNGRWRTAIEVPGLGPLNTGGSAGADSVSCGAAGNCAAVGGYEVGGSLQAQGFVASEKRNRWDKAIEVPGLGPLNSGGFASVNSVSCAAAGSCVAGGSYQDGSGHMQGFVVSEVNGRWRTAIEVPGLGPLNTGGFASVNSVSCAAAGNCAASGNYQQGSGHVQGFVASEVNGRWRKAIEIPGLGPLNKRGHAGSSAVSCGSVGNCAAGGSYQDGSGHFQGFVVSEKNGRWGKAIEVPGLGPLNKRGGVVMESVSCGSAGNCAAGGSYEDGAARDQGFLVSERNGRWSKAIEVPGLGPLNKGGIAIVYSVSCASAASCAATGTYTDASLHTHAFLISRS